MYKKLNRNNYYVFFYSKRDWNHSTMIGLYFIIIFVIISLTCFFSFMGLYVGLMIILSDPDISIMVGAIILSSFCLMAIVLLPVFLILSVVHIYEKSDEIIIL